MFTDSKARRLGRRILSALIAVVIVCSAGIRDAQAGERKFIVMLANSPKQFPATNGTPPGGLVDRAAIDNAYFVSNPNDGVDTFVEYWEEISYGDVTVAGRTTDWISLPWAIQPQGISPADFVRFTNGGAYSYGRSEQFSTGSAMIITDIDGDPGGTDNGPFIRGPGGGDFGRTAGNLVWMPGQRFLDRDADDKWDGLDEVNNVMDFGRDSRPDNLGPWVDLDGNGQPNNVAACIYLPDADNDGNPDCCPNGPGRDGCGGIREQEIPGTTTPAGFSACPSTTVGATGGGVTINDCNGNGIPDACDVPSLSNQGAICLASPECVATGWLNDSAHLCGSVTDPITGVVTSLLSPDQLPFTTQNNACLGVPDGIPDECQFSNWDKSLNAGSQVLECTSEAPNTSGTPVGGCPDDDREQCSVRVQNLTPRCEYDDSNNDGAPDVVEPFESFIRFGNAEPPSIGLPLHVNSTFGRDYITNNYPGHANKVINQSISRPLWAEHDPRGNSSTCVCADGLPCRDLGTCSGSNLLCRTSIDCPDGVSCNLSILTGGMCLAGSHLAYTSPDFWIDSVATSKMRTTSTFSVATTERPSWYEQAWKDRYPESINGSCLPSCAPNCTEDQCVPVWDPTHTIRPGAGSPVDNDRIVGMSLVDASIRRRFDPNLGGLFGDGTGSVGTGNALIRILPEELNVTVAVPNASLVLFDGFVEHDDLPSSKYHQGGDQRLGEVTSPTSASIFGQDISPVINGGDAKITAAGPYAVGVHGNLDTDAGNVLSMEILTWRWQPPFNDGQAWEGQAGKLYQRPTSLHPYASLATHGGEGMGFRDYNLDGLIDQGEVRPVGSENYLNDASPELPRIPGTQTAYPWNRQRLVEDCVAVLDSIIDFDEFRDINALDAANCARKVPAVIQPPQFGGELLSSDGAVSGIVLLPNGSHGPTPDFLLAPSFFPIHDEDASSVATRLSDDLNWNLVFHDLVVQLPVGGVASDLNVTFAAHEYLHSWEGYPDLYDYDVFLPGAFGAKINTPVGGWDIMAGSSAQIVGGGLVHPSPILKESPCSEWIEPVDLTTILTPGVDKRITLPPSEIVRDDSHFFLENEDIPGERFYFWSVGSGIDTNMPSSGVLIQHTDVGGNPEALPSGQQSATRFQFLIVQADGLRQLEDGISPFGDAGDAFPGSTNNTSFTCDTTPSSQWYTFNMCSGLSVTDIQVDGNGSASAVFNLVPTSIPSLRFLQPAGGQTNSSGIFSIRTKVADSFGGTTVRLFYTNDKNDVSIDTTVSGNFIGEFNTTTPGTNEFDFDWDINGLADGQYFVFAELISGDGADGSEKEHTSPRNGRNNKGDGFLTVDNVNIPGLARFETWVVRALDADKWVVNSSLSQPDVGLCVGGSDAGEVCDVNSDCGSGNCDTDRFAHATTDVPYTSVNGEVTFTIHEGDDVPFRVNDTIAFSTAGITAPSAPVTILGGVISDDPIAIIVATPLSGPSPLTVAFDGRRSKDPSASQPLDFTWDFGDGSPTTTGTNVTEHTYTGAQTFTATLTVTNPQTGRSGEASVDVVLANNSPNAQMSATPLSGPGPLTVSFSSAGSSDNESDTSDLIFEWDFDDDQTAGTGVPGTFTSISHFYRDNGTYTASLTVTDPGGKSDTTTLDILVGNTRPVPVITTQPVDLVGTDPFLVTFNATGSTDADGDKLTVVWTFDEKEPADTTLTQDLSAIPVGSDGSVEHTYKIPVKVPAVTSANFTATAVLTETDCEEQCASVTTRFQIVVSAAPHRPEQPRARFTITPNPPVLGVSFEADASASVDSPDPEIPLVSYSWDWGDNSNSDGVLVSHTYVNSGRFAVTLSVTDVDGNVSSNTQIITVSDGDGDSDNTDPVAIIGTGPTSGSVPLSIEFNGLNSFDLDGDPLQFTWQVHFGDTLIDTLTGPIVTETFEFAGTFTVTLLVSDGRGGLGISNARIIEVDPRVGAPGQGDPGTPQPTPGDTTAPTPGICGLGMITSMFGSFVGLMGMMVSRRRMFWS